MEAHIEGAGDNLNAQVKAAAKYGGRILLAEDLAGLGTSSAEARSLIAFFTQSRWAVFEGDAGPQLVRQMLAQYARANGMRDQVTVGSDGYPNVSDDVRRAFVAGMRTWARGAVPRLHVIAVTAPQLEEPASE